MSARTNLVLGRVGRLRRRRANGRQEFPAGGEPQLYWYAVRTFAGARGGQKVRYPSGKRRSTWRMSEAERQRLREGYKRAVLRCSAIHRDALEACGFIDALATWVVAAVLEERREMSGDLR